MDFNEIIEIFRRNVLEHYFDTKGRVSRKEFWYFVLAVVVVSIVVSIVGSIIGLGLLRPLVALALLLPMLGMGVRRLQDTGRSGSLAWIGAGLGGLMQVLALISIFMFTTAAYGAYGYGYAAAGLFGPALMFSGLMSLVGLATLVVYVVLIYFWAQPGVKGANQFGEEPQTATPATAS